ncbi:c-type cytochrome biogenesis protein CcsB [Anaerobacillus sp. MEB173]|uniref:c-type cytochrome biogenesis protein CcsB n=1 Tax=Anaerobacillus sp. MEB173 TaxID=3383345 RepID=UPI003F8E53BA
MAALSSNLLLFAFFMYLAATISFAVSVTGKKWRNKEGVEGNRWGTFGYILTILGFLFSMGYFITRWIAGGHAPVSNMFEYLTFLGISMSLAFVIIYKIYKSNLLGLFTLPVVMLLIAYASVFPSEIQPLIPALQSYWLKIHVTTTALGQGILAIGFAAGLIYLIRVVDQKKKNKQTLALELVMYSLLSTLGFILVASIFSATNYQVQFSYVNERGQEAQIIYEMPAIAGPHEGEMMSEDRFGPLFAAPSWMQGVEAPRKLNTFIWSLIAGLILYGITRLILRKRISAAIQPFLMGASPQKIDEVSYRAIAIGFPVFTLGGLIFAMIWAQIAWTRFWGWDPKEVWALITFLFYAAYLHLRLSKGWQGEKSAWLCVIGFVLIMFNLLFINLVVAGLHSYA